MLQELEHHLAGWDGGSDGGREMSLEENLRNAIDAVYWVRQRMPYSSNYDHTSSPIRSHKTDIGIFRRNIFKRQRDAVTKVVQARSPRPQGSFNFETLANVLLEKKTKVGNCGEVAALACKYLKDKGMTGVEYVQVGGERFKDGTLNSKNEAVIPHIIAVVGRTGGSSSTGTIGLPDTWGEDAVICDPWDRVAYPALEYEFYWTGLWKSVQKRKVLNCYLLQEFS
jgi:hypothetical protein